MFEASTRMSLQTLICPSQFLGCTTKYTVAYEVSLKPTFSIQLSSHLRQTNTGSGDSPVYKKCRISCSALRNSQKTSLLGGANTIGIIGGVSAVSTLNFLEKLLRWTSNGEETLPFVVCSDPLLSEKLLFHERSSFSILNTKQSHTQLDPTPILENLRRKVTFLEEAGARCIVMPCNISHVWHDEISKGCSLPFLHVGECVAKELKEANLKTLEAGGSLSIGVLAGHVTLKAGFYQEKLQNEGFEVVLPDKATMEHTVIPAMEALNREDIKGAKNLFRIALQVLLVRDVETVILASDDMLDLFPRNDLLPKRCIDPMDALARSTINWGKSCES
ncbi:hypothetical protein IFM89_006792 [Coptis chinensis]|uniref:Aspartate racemase n=1 Tax=Coptis chinensis TaxID=261450 RepID=A0A835IB40_9MAGN|nr:hypothetical protein IFM89_006792 [Coptis chinensis]